MVVSCQLIVLKKSLFWVFENSDWGFGLTKYSNTFDKKTWLQSDISLQKRVDMSDKVRGIYKLQAISNDTQLLTIGRQNVQDI